MTRADDIVETIHDALVRDPYRWLEDEASPEVQAWMDAQDARTRACLAGYPRRDELARRVTQLFYYDAVGAPIRHGDREFYTRKHADKEKTVCYWKDARGEHVLFDPNTWSDDGSKSLHGWWPSYDGTRVAYSISEHNSDETVMHVLDVASGEDLPDVLTGTKYAAASWTPDGHGFYYTWVPPVGQVPTSDRPGYAQLRFHALGTDPAADPVVHDATHDPQTFLGGGISRDGHWLLVFIQHGWNSTDVYFRDARNGGSWQPLVVGVDANFDVAVWRDQLYVTTNDGAPRYRVFKVDPARPERAAWREIVAQAQATLQATQIVGEHLVLTYLRNAASEIEIRDLDGHLVHALALPPLGTVSGMSGNPDEDIGYVAYTSFTEPQVIYKASVAAGTVEEWTRVELPVDTTGFVTEQVFYPSKDGTQISMFLIHRADARKGGTNPTILYGYGGFNVSLTPAFAGSRAVWLEHGGVYAIPNLRGGGEYGEDWHQAGMGSRKQNVFDDFIAAAEYLVREGWTSPAHLAISGGSNGGLLVGAAVTQRPELFGAVICAVPLLDMLRYHLYGSGKTWIPEYGSADDPAQFATLWAYSPYRIAIDAGRRAYPAVLFDSADHDDRVDPLHARKLTAALQAAQTGDAPILLRIERNSGHGGADMVKAQVDRVADQFAFLLARLS
jgi:prolyl oligopeptidase